MVGGIPGEAVTAVKARATASSRAAEEERPEPCGTSPLTTPSQPAGRNPAVVSAQVTPRRYSLPTGIVLSYRRPIREQSRLPGSQNAIGAQRPDCPSRTERSPDRPVDRQGKDKAVVVIGVFADQVDSAGSTHTRKGGFSENRSKNEFSTVWRRDSIGFSKFVCCWRDKTSAGCGRICRGRSSHLVRGGAEN